MNLTTKRKHGIFPVAALSILLFSAVSISAEKVDGSIRIPESKAGAISERFGVIKGIVSDSTGNPIADATVAVFRHGVDKALRQVRSAANGSYLLRILPGKYIVLAVAQGYNPVTLSEVTVDQSEELNFGFRLERSGSGNTLPEKRLDRNNPKWVRRAAALSRSVYQNVDNGRELIPDDDIAESSAETGGETLEIAANAANEDLKGQFRPGQSIVETFFASSENGGYVGINYATLLPLGEKADLLIAAQAGSTPEAPRRVEAKFRLRPSETHQLRFGAAIGSFGNLRFPAAGKQKSEQNSLQNLILNQEPNTRQGIEPTPGVEKTIEITRRPESLGQLSVQALDEWRVREGVIFVYGIDYSQFLGGGGSFSVAPRLGLQLDVDPKTRFRAAYTTQTEERTWEREIELENAEVEFREPAAIEDIVIENGRAVMGKSRRLEFGVERVLDNRSSIEANAFFDTTIGRGIGLINLPFEGGSETFGRIVGTQHGSAQGIRIVYSRRLNGRLSAGGGYSFGTGQALSDKVFAGNPDEFLKTDIFHTFFGQVEADLKTGTNIRTVFRLSPQATVFAIDPFRGRLAIYDPSLNILVTQNLPNLGLPFQAEAVIDARNLLDFQTGVTGEDGIFRIAAQQRMLRGGILVRF